MLVKDLIEKLKEFDGNSQLFIDIVDGTEHTEIEIVDEYNLSIDEYSDIEPTKIIIEICK